MLEYTIVYDGVPRMDGTHQRCQMGTFKTLTDAYKALIAASVRGEYPNVRIERRAVGPWETISQNAFKEALNTIDEYERNNTHAGY